MARRELTFLAIGGVICIALLGGLWMSRDETHIEIVQQPDNGSTTESPPIQATVIPATTESRNDENGALVVSVLGGVVAPGVYSLSPGDRVTDALEEAGGLAELADARNLNLAAKLVDGSTLGVPWLPEAMSSMSELAWSQDLFAAQCTPAQYLLTGWRESATSNQFQQGGRGGSGRININLASRDELISLPNIGPAYADRIIAYRSRQPFTSVDELTNISGIGEKRLAALRDLVCIR